AARPRPGRAPRDGDGAAMRILLVRPTASGGLAAHVDHELALLTAAGQEVAEAPVRIRERPHPLADLRTVRTLRSVLVASPAPVPPTPCPPSPRTSPRPPGAPAPGTCGTP